jgi:hypothetical protein
MSWSGESVYSGTEAGDSSSKSIRSPASAQSVAVVWGFAGVYNMVAPEIGGGNTMRSDNDFIRNRCGRYCNGAEMAHAQPRAFEQEPHNEYFKQKPNFGPL